MIQRICPVCDQVMKSAHYCRTCRRWVREPWVRDVSYYLNERHPQDEHSCSYHEPERADRRVYRQPSGASAQPNEPRPGRTRAAGEWPWPTKKSSPVQKDRTIQKGKTAQKKKSGKAIVIVVAIYLIFQAVIAGFGFVGNSVVRLFENADYDIDLGDFTETFPADEDGAAYHELEDAEVIEAGKPCSMYGHFDLQGELLQDTILDTASDQGLEVEDIYYYSDNVSYNDGDCWYSTVISMNLTMEGSDCFQYVEINSDTATGDLHEVSVSLEDGSRAAAVAEAVIRYMEAEGAIPEDMDVSGAMMSEIRTMAVSGDSGSFAYGDVEISVYNHADGCSIYISHARD